MRSQLSRHFGATVRAACRPGRLSEAAPFGTTGHTFKKATQMPPRPTLPDSELHHVYLKGSGPGGQKINKTNSACQLTHIPTGIVVKSQATRSRSQNHNIARRILAEKIELLEKGDSSRVAVKTAAASRKKASKRKKASRKYRKLEEGKEEVEDAEYDLEEEELLIETAAEASESHSSSDVRDKCVEHGRKNAGNIQEPEQVRAA